MPTFDETRKMMQQSLHLAIDRDFANTHQMQEICRYGLDGGKLVRAVLLHAMATTDNVRAFAANGHAHKAIHEAATSLEFIHAASLMLDDSMDEDEERRGKPSVYVKYGTTASQLAAMQLMTTAFVKICRATHALRDCYGDARGNELGAEMFKCLSENLQSLNVGQYLDVFPTNHSLPQLGDKFGRHAARESEQVEEVIRKKTVTLFEVALVHGWLLRDGVAEKIPVVRDLAHAVGMLFQIADDCEDYEMDLERAGKNCAMNHVIQHGRAKTLRRTDELASRTRSLCLTLGLCLSPLDELVAHLVASIHFYCQPAKSRAK